MPKSCLLYAIGLLLGCACASGAETNVWAGSSSCRECHGKFYQLWSTSFHGLAMQPYTAQLAQSKLHPQKAPIVSGKYQFIADLSRGLVRERTPFGENSYPIVQVMGGKNVFYFLTALERGMLQVLPVAYDVRRSEWFDTAASAMRHFGDRHDEALYWKDRPFTFNSSCFSCHVSQLSKNYDLATDTYHTTWAEPGINCETCHGPSRDHVRIVRSLSAHEPPPADLKLVLWSKLSITERNESCAPCHARMSPITADFAPGDRYFDHFDLGAFENSDFYPDGRDLGENYTYTLWRSSECAKSGKLDCLHCHTSSGRYRFAEPGNANAACLPCHEEQVKNSSAHSHHQINSKGSQCVSCHMPTTEFARMRRTDHSMRPPTPATTLVYQSPNACNLCHTKQDAAWSDRFVRQWITRDYQKPVLERAALIAAARNGNWDKLPKILAYLANGARDEIQTVSLVRLLEPCDSPEKWPVLRALATDRSPLVRAASVEALGQQLDEANLATLLKAAHDEYRLVRVKAATALASVREENVPEQSRSAFRHALREAFDSLNARPDDLSSHYNLGNLFMAGGQMAQALSEFETAMRFQSDALPVFVNAALACNALGQNEKAERYLRQAVTLDPTNSVAQLNLGMLSAEMGKLLEAEQAFRAAFKSDPHSARAAYNLGILLSKDHPSEGLDWCARAVRLDPGELKYSYTYAFYLELAGRIEQALGVIHAARERNPEDENCAALERELLRRQAAKQR